MRTAALRRLGAVETARHIAGMTPRLSVTIPLRTQSELNIREHHMVRARRVRAQRMAVWASLHRFGGDAKEAGLSLPIRVEMTRIAPGKLDSDNLAGSFKHVRDEIAKWFRVDDGDERYDWQCRQSKGRVGEYAVQIAFYEVPT